MIYANEYGTVDLLSEQFLQSLKRDEGTIGVKLSGGADTALLLHLLAKEISERKLKFSILPYTFNDKPDRFIVAQNIIHNESQDKVRKYDPLNLIDIDVNRNAFGRQIDSFVEKDIIATLIKDLVDTLNEIINPINKEEIIKNIFSSFCVGK